MKLAIAGLVAGVVVGAAAKPRTLAYADAPIVAFAQESTHIAWSSRKNCLGLVRIRDLAARTQRALGEGGDGDCDHLRGQRLAVAGPRALWSTHDTGNSSYFYVVAGGAIPKARIVGINAFDLGPYGIGDHLGALAGGGGELLWSKVRVSVRGSEDCDLENTCIPFVKGGGVYRVVGARSRLIPGTPPAVLLATDGKRIALLPAGIGGPAPRAKPNAKVEVRRLAGGLVSTFAPTGPPEALAVSGANVAVLTRNAVEFRSLAGALLWKKAVPAAATALSLSPLGIVYRVGRTIRRYDLTGLPSVVAAAKGEPIGLSAVGRRVAWAENVRLRGSLVGRMQALDVG